MKHWCFTTTIDITTTIWQPAPQTSFHTPSSSHLTLTLQSISPSLHHDYRHCHQHNHSHWYHHHDTIITIVITQSPTASITSAFSYNTNLFNVITYFTLYSCLYAFVIKTEKTICVIFLFYRSCLLPLVACRIYNGDIWMLLSCRGVGWWV